LIQHRTTAPMSPSDPESDEIICSNWGIGVSYKIQESNRPEKRAFSTEELTVKSRTSVPTALARHDIGVASLIGETDIDVAGYKIDVEMHSPMNKVKDVVV
jgi:transcription initiation factor TFIIB